MSPSPQASRFALVPGFQMASRILRSGLAEATTAMCVKVWYLRHHMHM
jgi:hypothetical protein